MMGMTVTFSGYIATLFVFFDQHVGRIMQTWSSRSAAPSCEPRIHWPAEPVKLVQ